jgi:hypothetical protein
MPTEAGGAQWRSTCKCRFHQFRKVASHRRNGQSRSAEREQISGRSACRSRGEWTSRLRHRRHPKGGDCQARTKSLAPGKRWLVGICGAFCASAAVPKWNYPHAHRLRRQTSGPSCTSVASASFALTRTRARRTLTAAQPICHQHRHQLRTSALDVQGLPPSGSTSVVAAARLWRSHRIPKTTARARSSADQLDSASTSPVGA